MGRRRENRVQLRKWRIILNMVEMVGEEKVVERALEEVVVEKAMEKNVVEKAIAEKLVEKGMEENVAMMEEKVEGEKEKAGGEMVETASPSPKPGWGAALPTALTDSPAVACWRPWERIGEEEYKGETWQPWSPQIGQSRKIRRSPAAARRSKLRLQK